jgi:ParB-like chromosome segregation protein Spo0J
MTAKKPTAKQAYDAALLGGMDQASGRASAAPYGGTEPPSPGAAPQQIKAAKDATFGAVEYVSPADLLPGPQPFGAPDPDLVRKLADTIKKSGKLDPLVANRRSDGKLYLIDGHTRHKAIAVLGSFETVPVQIARVTLTADDENAWAEIFQHHRRNATFESRETQYRKVAAQLGFQLEAVLTASRPGPKPKSESLSQGAINSPTPTEIAKAAGVPKHRADRDFQKIRETIKPKAKTAEAPTLTAAQYSKRRAALVTKLADLQAQLAALDKLAKASGLKKPM